MLLRTHTCLRIACGAGGCGGGGGCDVPQRNCSPAQMLTNANVAEPKFCPTPMICWLGSYALATQTTPALSRLPGVPCEGVAVVLGLAAGGERRAHIHVTSPLESLGSESSLFPTSVSDRHFSLVNDRKGARVLSCRKGFSSGWCLGVRPLTFLSALLSNCVCVSP